MRFNCAYCNTLTMEVKSTVVNPNVKDATEILVTIQCRVCTEWQVTKERIYG